MMYISPHFYFWHCSLPYYVMPKPDPESSQNLASDDIYITPFLFLALLPSILCNANARSRISSKLASDNIYITPFPFLALLHPVLCNANVRFRIFSKHSFQ